MAIDNQDINETTNSYPQVIEQKQWEEQLRREAARLADEDLNAEADAW